MKIDLEYEPRWYQLDFEKAMEEKSRALLVWHRRAGKDIACLNFMVLQAIRKTGLYYYILPTYRQAKKVIWDGMSEEGRKILDCAIPKKLIKARNNTDLKLELITGSIIQLVGSDNYDALAGTNPCGVVHSEFSLQDPACWQMIIRPILRKNNGWAVFNGTPRGKNHQWELDQMAKANPNEWFYQKLSVEDTSLIPLSALDQERREGVSEELIQQEYYCSYDRGVEGSYYGRLLEQARREGRIAKVPYETNSVVHTSWDLGFGDSTAIIWWQEIGKEIRILDYYEATGEGLEHFVKQLKLRCYAYGTHFVPHDAENGSLQTGKSLVDMARDFGLKFTVLKRTSFESGIEAGRVLMGISWFDQNRCNLLLKHLSNYHKKYNEKMNCYSDRPEHDSASHGCFTKDALISTSKGNIPIIDIKVGDMVKTPNGYKKVTHLHCFHANKLIEIKTSKGKSLVCTVNHKIFTNNSLVYADALRYNDTLINEEKEGMQICQKYTGYHGEKTNLGFRDIFLLMNQKQKSYSTENITDGTGSIIKEITNPIQNIRDYIVRFGHIITGKFQKITTFITSILIQKTMRYQTCNVCINQNIPNLEQKQIGGLEAKKINKNFEKTIMEPKLGTEARREKNGILNEQKNNGIQEKNMSLNARFAKKQQKHHIQIKQNIVRLLAGLKVDALQVLMMLKENVKHVIKNLRSTNISKTEHVLEIVPGNYENPINVYDITVEDDHCYYANGILVSNSDAFRYLAISRLQYGGASIKKEQIDEWNLKYRNVI